MPTTLTSSENVAIIHWDDGKANAVNFELIDAMNQHLDKVERDADALVIVGRPGVFCGGFDLKILREASDETVEDLIEQGGELAERLFSFPKPVVIASTGHAIAQGAAFLLSADFRIGARGTFKTGLNETQIGMTLRHFGPTLAKARLAAPFFTRAAVLGELFDPEDALNAGYLDELNEPIQIETAAINHARAFAKLPKKAFYENKLLMRREAIEALKAKSPL